MHLTTIKIKKINDYFSFNFIFQQNSRPFLIQKENKIQIAALERIKFQKLKKIKQKKNKLQPTNNFR